MKSFSRLVLLAVTCFCFPSQTPTLLAQSCNDDYYVRFPDDRILTACDGTGQFGVPAFFKDDSLLIATSFSDDTFYIVPDACYKIERSWRIINWCTYDPACALTRVPNPNPNPVVNHAGNRPGPVVSDRCGGPLNDPWRATEVKISPVDTAATNFCTFWRQALPCHDSAKFNGYIYTQTIKIIDGQRPKATCLPPNGCDLSDNDPGFWHSNDWWDAAHQSHDLNEMPIDLELTASDLCSGPNVQFRCLLYLDLDNDGLFETVVDSRQPQLPNTVFFGNASLPNFQGGTPRAFDQRTVADPNLDYYRFALQVTRNGPNATAALRFVNQRNPNEYRPVQLPHGRHKIKWMVEDNCGNQTICEQPLIIKDCQKPSIHCKELSVNIMQTGIVTLWASDFLESASDNATPAELLTIALSKGEPAPAQFPIDPANGLPIVQVSFTCADLGPNVVQLWVKDAAGNANYCQVPIAVNDGIGVCVDKASVVGYVQTQTGKPMPNVYVVGSIVPPPFPSIELQTDTSGFFKLSNAIPISAIGELCAIYDENYLNGVNVLDLIMLEKYILGMKILSGLKIVAADANRSGTITTFDAIELRRLILGIYQELPNNLSWRFFDQSTIPFGPFNPYTLPPIKECAKISPALPNVDTLHFIGIKIGDLNDTALPNMVMDSVKRTVFLDASDQTFEAGQEIEVTLTASDTIAGQQFTLEHPGLEFVSLNSGTIDLFLNNFGIFPQNHILTHAWGTQEAKGTRPSFTLRFRALSAGTLSQQLHLSDLVTQTEAYGLLHPVTCAAERLKVALRFLPVGTGEPARPKAPAFVLYQNQPNPFTTATAIGFYAPKAGAATLTVSDATGKQLLHREGVFEQGYNQFVLEPDSLPAKGLFFYTVETQGFALTKTMERF